MRNKTQGIYIWILYSFLFAYLSYCTVLALISATADDDNISIQQVTFTIALIFMLLLIYVFPKIKLLFQKRIFLIPALLAVYFIPLVLIKSLLVTNFIANYTSIASWSLAFLFGICIGANNADASKVNKFALSYLLIILPASIFIIAQYYITYNLFDSDTVSDSFFIIVMYTPMTLLINRKKLRSILFCTLFCMGVISFKRSIIIAEIIALLTFYFSNRQLSKKISKSKDSIGSTLLVLISVFVIWFLNSNYSDFIIQRFSGIMDDGGSERTLIYARLMEMLTRADSIELFFGYGFNSVHENIGIYSHNDFFTLLLDYGIVGVVLYIIFLVSLLKCGFRLLNHEYTGNYGVIMLYSLVLLIVISSTNNVIVSPALSSPIMLALGLIVGISYRVK